MDLRTGNHFHTNTRFISCHAGPVVTILTSTTAIRGPHTSRHAMINSEGSVPVRAVTVRARSAPVSPLTSAAHQLSRIRRRSTVRRSQPTIASRDNSCLLPRNKSSVQRPTVRSAARRMSKSSASWGASNVSRTCLPRTVTINTWLKLLSNMYSMAIRNIAAVMAMLETIFGIR